MGSTQFVFQAVRGIQAGMEYFVTMVPLDCLPKLFVFCDAELPASMRAQRTLNKARIPAIRDYILKNPTSYVFSALTASVDGEIRFTPIGAESSSIGTISIDSTSKLLINDGQHRRAAITEALKQNSDLKYEHIPIVLYHDIGLKRSQQIFADLNKYALRPTHSLNIMYDNRELYSKIAKEVVSTVPTFDGLVDFEHTAISNKSRALFTLSAIYGGTKALLVDNNGNYDEKKCLAIQFWNAVSCNMNDWNDVKNGKLKAYIVRQQTLASLSITIKGLGTVGAEMIRDFPDDWEKRLENLSTFNWRKDNPCWKDGIVVDGSVVSSRATQKVMEHILRDILKG